MRTSPRKYLIIVASLTGWIVGAHYYIHARHLTYLLEAREQAGSISDTCCSSTKNPTAPIWSTPSPTPSTAPAAEEQTGPTDQPLLDNHPATAHPHHHSTSSAEWRANRLLADLEKHMAFPEQLRQQVRTILVKQQAERYSSAVRFDEDLRRALGEKAADLEQRIVEHEHEQERRERERESAALAHQLGLSAEQERQLSSSIESVDASLAPTRTEANRLIEEAMQKHLAPNPNRAALRDAMSTIEQTQEALKNSRKEALAKELRQFLTPEQYQAWLNQTAAE